jgi:hypothetical protein
LTIFYLYFKTHQEIYDNLLAYGATSTVPNHLIQSLTAFNKREFAIGKVNWLKQFPQFDFSVSATVNVWGCEQDMFSPSLTEILHTTQESNCDSPDCPQRRKTNESDGIFLVSLNVKRKQNEKNLRQY